MRVSCDATHLHYIQPFQFVDSPEWEANREQSDDVFQVRIAFIILLLVIPSNMEEALPPRNILIS